LYTTDLVEAAHDADLVTESVPAVPDIKRQVCLSLNGCCPARTVFTANSQTSCPDPAMTTYWNPGDVK